MTLRRPSWRYLLILTGLLLFAQAFPLPGVVRDAATLAWPDGFHWEWPVWHLVFTPFCSLADYLTVLSLNEQIMLQVGVPALLLLLGGLRRGLMCWGLWLVFLAWGALVPRPTARLVSDNPRDLLIDFHSHTQFSHDGRPSFTPLANMEWHKAQGFNAAFITDHNRVEASELANEQSKKDWRQSGYYSLRGEEISLYKTHLLLLGNHVAVDNRPYDSDVQKIPAFLQAMHAQRWLVLGSLPEYWLYHWGEVRDMVDWGMDGFEIINSAPKALDFPLDKRRFIVDLCTEHNLPFTGISDNHGYGYATAVWNVMSVPGWRHLDPDQLELTVLMLLKKAGPRAVRVLERPKFWPANDLELVLSPLGNALTYLRLLTPAQRGIWVLWLWGLWFLGGLLKKYMQRQTAS